MICRHCFRIIKESEKSVKRGKRHFHESCVRTIEQKEVQNSIKRIKQFQAEHPVGEKELVKKDNSYDNEMNVKPTVYYSNTIEELEYLDVIETIRDEIRDYEGKYGDDGLNHMIIDRFVGQLNGTVTAKEIIAEYERERKRERREWDKLFEGGEAC